MSILLLPDQVSPQRLIDSEILTKVVANPVSGALQILHGSLVVKEGLHVDQTPWTYFDDMSTFDTSSLMPCSGSLFSDTTIMADYVQITGDTDGLDSEGRLNRNKLAVW